MWFTLESVEGKQPSFYCAMWKNLANGGRCFWMEIWLANIKIVILIDWGVLGDANKASKQIFF